MHTKRLYLYAASLMACGILPFTPAVAAATLSEESSAPPLYRPWTLGLEAGTTGLGGSVSWRFADHWGARFGFDYFELSDNGWDIKALTYDAKLRIMSEPLTLDFYPWKEHSFHISVGLQFNQNQLTGTADDTGNLSPPDGVGMLNLKVEQQPVNPYLSIGGNFFYFDRAHRWALGGELGVTYTGDPKVSLTRSGPPSPLLDALIRVEQDQIEDYADKFRWWPVVKLMVNYSF
jgi:hypothetical protein